MKLYDVYDGMKYIGEMTVDQISELTGKTRRQVSRAVYSACLLDERYAIVYDGRDTICKSNKNDMRMLMEFDALAGKIRRAVGWES